jgi:hypothetical protein
MLREPQPALNGRRSVYEVLDLNDDQKRGYMAAHEAGHVVAGVEVGMVVDEVVISPGLGKDGRVAGFTRWKAFDVPWIDYAVKGAAGERASRRWLKENGLSTPDRRWAGEVLGLDDRNDALQRAQQIGVKVGFGGPGDIDWRDVQDAADDLLDRRWDLVEETAHTLERRDHLTGAEVEGVLQRHGDLHHLAPGLSIDGDRFLALEDVRDEL